MVAEIREIMGAYAKEFRTGDLLFKLFGIYLLLVPVFLVGVFLYTLKSW